MNEPRLSSDLDANLDNPMAPFVYAVNTLHCLTVSLAGDGAGLVLPGDSCAATCL